MRVAGLTSSGDWQFGRGRASYLAGSNAIAQKLTCRLRSFRKDYFLDTEHGEDWLVILGTRGNQQIIRRTVERCALLTPGVVAINKLSIDSIDANRAASITLNYDDVYNADIPQQVQVP